MPPKPALAATFAAMTLQNDLILRAADGVLTERTPVWLMRQAGRILPEYRAVRNGLGSFKELVETPERAAEVTVQPVDLLGVDAAIIFSDILVVPEAMGLEYQMIENKGPWFPKTIETSQDIDNLRSIQGPELSYVYEAIKITKKILDNRVPLIGFAGAPWTILAYMIEGSGSKTFSKARRFLYLQPQLAHQLLDKIADSTISYLKKQIAAGADLLQIFDSWAGILPADHYREFSLAYIRKIVEAIEEVPLTVFAKGAYFALSSMSEVPCRTIGLDWNMSVEKARQHFPDKTLQGNLDPCALYGSFDQIAKATKKMLDRFEGHPHIANLGHGVYPDTSPDHVRCFIDTVKEYTS